MLRFAVVTAVIGGFAVHPPGLGAQEPGSAAPLEIQLLILNEGPIPGEPLKVRVSITNNSSSPQEVPGIVDKSSLGFEWSRDDRGKERLSPADYLSNKGNRPRPLAPQESIVTHEMLILRSDSGSEPQGKEVQAITAAFKGVRSNTVKVKLGDPEGPDKEALELLRQSNVLRYLTLYVEGPIREKALADLKSCLERFPGSRFSPWIRVALATHEWFKGSEDIANLKAGSPAFQRAVELLEAAAETPKFPFRTELKVRIARMHIGVGLTGPGKTMLAAAKEANDLPESWRFGIDAELKKSNSFK